LRKVGLVLLILISLGVSLAARAALEPEHEDELLMDMAYLPNGRMLRWISGGMDNMMSDLLWLRSLRYVMDHFDTGRDYTYLYRAYDIITDLDPNFQKAYRFGAYFLSGMTDEYENARDLLKKGWDHNPTSWKMAYDLGSVYDLHLKDRVKAAEWFEKAAHLPDCPPGLRQNADLLYLEGGRLDRALAMWASIYETTGSDKLKKVAEWNIKRVNSLMIIKELTAFVEKFRELKEHLPASLSDVAAARVVVDKRVLQSVPKDAFDEDFVYTRRKKDGGEEFSIESRELIRKEVDKRMLYFRNLGLRPFRRRFGRWPESLQELVDKKIVERLPSVPHGIEYDYDPETGELSYDKTLERYNLGQ
jgi:tetratricopeptide (TPR) repeat protein